MDNTQYTTKGLARYYSHFKHRSTSYYNPFSGALWSEASGLHTLPMGSPLAVILDACDTRVLYFLPDSQGKYINKQELLHVPGIKVNRLLADTGSGELEYQGKTIAFYPISVWFSVEPGNNTREVITAMKTLQKLIEDEFQPIGVHRGTKERLSIPLLSTPAFMGSDLLRRSLPYEQDYATLPEQECTLLTSVLPQGRVETFYHGEDNLEEAYAYDGRWMYSACVRHVPTGFMVHDNVGEVAYTPPSKTGSRGFIAGFYRVRAHVPDNWYHIGLLPCKLFQGKRVQNYYPNQPGEVFETWCTSPELSLALKHGWGIEVLERILFPDTDKSPEPLLNWSRHLIHIRQEVAPTLPEPIRGMVRDATRNLLNHTVGALNRGTTERDAYSTLEDMPESGEAPSPYEDTGLYQYYVESDLSALQKKFFHPEISQFVYGLARKKLAEAALSLDFNTLVALRVDAVWASCPCTFEDTGKVGQFVKKPLVNNTGLLWPKDTGDMLKIVKSTKGVK